MDRLFTAGDGMVVCNLGVDTYSLITLNTRIGFINI